MSKTVTMRRVPGSWGRGGPDSLFFCQPNKQVKATAARQRIKYMYSMFRRRAMVPTGNAMSWTKTP